MMTALHESRHSTFPVPPRTPAVSSDFTLTPTITCIYLFSTRELIFKLTWNRQADRPEPEESPSVHGEPEKSLSVHGGPGSILAEPVKINSVPYRVLACYRKESSYQGSDDATGRSPRTRALMTLPEGVLVPGL
ncbi:Hypp904 [Branchiostoma lanceolatum]|uniref:Hypp904 protein n=1 Tax=Branchiostoma lanceolatum TaxID=7740 RepID=A0A8K0EGN8_BRALA|nr:Hypp904 [Branchiostoma lanceolatum]